MNFQKIEGLTANKQLRRLYLYSNMITKIENLSHLSELEKLWLNNNEITEIEVQENVLKSCVTEIFCCCCGYPGI